MAIFYSHAGKDKNGKKVGTKELKVHTFGVLEKALGSFFSGVEFKYTSQKLSELINEICLFHDLGKYTSHFQNYLLGKPFDEILKRHARFGAYAIYNRYETKKELAFLAYYLVRNHHRNLHYPPSGDDLLLPDQAIRLERDFRKQKESILPFMSKILEDTQITNLKNYLKAPNGNDVSDFLEEWLEYEIDIQNYFIINYLFSLLIEADKLDASDTSKFGLSNIPNNAVDLFLQKGEREDNEQNRLRNQVRQEVVSKLQDSTILDYRIFLLAAPTGIGKTYTALDFALRMRDMLPNNAQIITGLPFINIIEQTIDEYEKVLNPHNIKVLGHYQFADVMGTEKEKTSSGEKDSEKDYSQKRMELNTWQGDVIVTSFVQLLQTIISNKNRLLLKFNHFAGAIIIIDEVQSLRLEQVPVIGAIIYFMSKFMNTRFLLMTATKPLIFELADREILSKQGEIKSTETIKSLLDDPEKIFKKFHRTKIVPLVDKKLQSSDDFLEVFKDKWVGDKACLVVCNTVNRSIEVFRSIEKYLKKEYKNPLYYLSTNVVPAQRLGIIKRIKEDIKAGNHPILVSTQVIEAGVDLDFDMGFRDLAPVDSIVQVAGRINRENSPKRKYSPLYIINFGDCEKIYGIITQIQSLKALGKKEILEPAYFTLVEDYFWNISKRNSYAYSRKLFEGIKQLRYDGEKTKEYIPVNHFEVIKYSSHAISVFIELNEQAKEAKKAFLKRFTAKNRDEKYKLKELFERNYKRTFHQHIITIPMYLTDNLPLLDKTKVDMRIKYVKFSELNNWYLDKVGFNRESKVTNVAKEENKILNI